MKRLLLVILPVLLACTTDESENAALLLINGNIWTGNAEFPHANWIAVTGDKITSMGEGEPTIQADSLIDLEGQLTLPGFNDSHVHFASAGQLLLGINLLDVNNDVLFMERVVETTRRLPNGSWITRGDWGAYEAWELGSEGGNTHKAEWLPSRSLIDSLTSEYPVLVTRYDRKVGLANATALDYLGLDSESGILRGAQLKASLESIPEKSFDRKLAETRRGLMECRKWGITTVQDMSSPDQLEVYQTLRQNGELTCRINFSPSRLSDYVEMKDKGWVIDYSGNLPHPAGDEWISFGTLKTHIDGIMGGRTARFYEPYIDNRSENLQWRGGWREFSKDMPSYKQMIMEADGANIQMRIHAIGDEANVILLDILDSMELINGVRDRRFRIVHAQVIRQQDFIRFQGKNVVAEVQPYHVSDDMRWMEERIGYERCKGAYAFQTLGSKWMYPFIWF